MRDLLVRLVGLLDALSGIRVPALGDGRRCAWCFGERHAKDCRLGNLLDDAKEALSRL